MGPEFMIARRHFRSLRARRRISFTIGIAAVGVALGVSSLVIVMSVMNGYTNMIRERLLGVNAHLTVRKSYRKPISDYGPVIRTLEDHPEVLAASPFIHAEGFVFRKPAAAGVVKSGVLVRGVDPGAFVRTSEVGTYIRDGTIDLGPREQKGSRAVHGILLGQVLAQRLDAGPGDDVYLGLVPKDILGGRGRRWQRYRVTGVFNTGYFEFDSRLVYVSLDAARRDLVWQDAVTGIRMRLRDPMAADRLGATFRQLLRETYPGLFASSWTRNFGSFYVLIQLQKWTFFLILSLIVVVAGFNIISILTMNVTDRRREIGILKAMGMIPGRIGRIFTLEGLVVGVTGIAIGNLLGFSVCWIQKQFEVIRVPGEVYYVSALPVEMRPEDFGLVSLCAILICYLFSLYPSRDAAALDPVDAIRYE
ncbi:MAG: ABC transporter permease [Gemmatimonadetes bacterium]|nr:ABC transporter permease [Gemmatimonadota bacterium]